MTFEEKANYLGFDICEWGPEEQDVCEKCGEKNIQMWFSGNSDYGIYWCLNCIIKLYEENYENNKIKGRNYDKEINKGIKER